MDDSGDPHRTKVLLNWKVNAMIDEFVECGLHFLAIAKQERMIVLRPGDPW
ncbi:hypothetical protein HanRHA438_Chr07g0315081 [Helianthus annuus]|uniref:Uncharacterized protein n=1 Tax=Helianthus annuus TaxID=4232 RepID=A0A9K3NGL3_HELAN|nr:hypothetical protein HanXRQr2_Chr07g0305951 [Helianthus annuus]KAJ0550993.1 hypothetical protein HanHA300_Chr07g0252131 [Helianthus annuus]KAJ0563952.1 hypothetical protein HanHA89_Chr07g0268831 [Helianthus annuus]KAJ0729282.1 hypothetical protein HanLR1_Chr07g0251171 [Helianthus annuus]KAJ0908855.1 hypothetical protein HanRHA438_Chr07g0315081 [Helianthus annuus]